MSEPTYAALRDPADGSVRTDFVLRSDGALIPADPDNMDWQAFEAWRRTNVLAEPPALDRP